MRSRPLVQKLEPLEKLGFLDVALLGACGFLLVVALLAAFVPARRATKIDPAKAPAGGVAASAEQAAGGQC